MKKRGRNVKIVGGMEIGKPDNPEKKPKISTLYTTDTISPEAGFEPATAITVRQYFSQLSYWDG